MGIVQGYVETSYQGKSLTLAERGRNGLFKINDDDEYDDNDDICV